MNILFKCESCAKNKSKVLIADDIFILKIKKEMRKIKLLKEFEKQFQDILECDDLEQERKDIQLSALMTEMEREFKIPMLKEEKYEKENGDVIALYRKISMSRKLENE